MTPEDYQEGGIWRWKGVRCFQKLSDSVGKVSTNASNIEAFKISLIYRLIGYLEFGKQIVVFHTSKKQFIGEIKQHKSNFY